MSVTVVHLMPTLMERQLDAAAGELLQPRSRRARHRVLHRRPDRGDPRRPTGPRACVLADGREIPADLVVHGGRHPAQYRPGARRRARRQPRHPGRRRHAHLRPRHLRGRRMRRAPRRRFSAWSRRSGSRPRCAARASPATTRRSMSRRRSSPSLKVTGIDVFSAGELGGGRRARRRDHAARRQARRLQEARAARRTGSSACVLYGSVADGPWYFQLMRDKADVSAFRDRWSSAGPSPRQAGAPLPESMSPPWPTANRSAAATASRKGKICRAIRDKGLTTLDAVRAHTKASASCGSCTAPGRGAPGACHRRRGGPLRRPADVQMHRARARRGAPRDRRTGADDDPDGHAGARLEDRPTAAQNAARR